MPEVGTPSSSRSRPPVTARPSSLWQILEDTSVWYHGSALLPRAVHHDIARNRHHRTRQPSRAL